MAIPSKLETEDTPSADGTACPPAPANDAVARLKVVEGRWR